MTDPAIVRYWVGRLLAVLLLAMAVIIAAVTDIAPWWFGLPLAVGAAAVGRLLSRDSPPDAPRRIEAEPQQEPVPPADDLPPMEELVELIEGPLLIVDPRRRVALANGPARRLLGDHIVGRDIRLALRHAAAVAVLTDGAPAGTEMELPGLGAGEQSWLLRADPYRDWQIIRLIDRTPIRAAERMRVDFVANASHELRTPLATLIGFVETLEGPAAEDADARRRFLAIMRGEAQRMIRLVDDLMSLSRIESNKHAAPVTQLSLPPLIDELRSTLGQQLQAGGRTLIFEAQGDIPPIIGDRDQLLQLLYNLVVNAIKYGRAGTPITIGLRRDGRNMVRLSVTDEGEGIAPEHLPRLTERFYRVDTGRSRAVMGTGLGLAIVKHIVERHRGQLLIDSEQGVGTRVTALLPAAGADGS